MLAVTQRRTFWILARTDAKDLVRDKLTAASMLTLALVLLVIHTTMWLAFSVAGDAPRIAASTAASSTAASSTAAAPPSPELAAALAPFAVTPGAQPNTRVDVADGRVAITKLEPGVGWDPLGQSLRAAGVPAGSIDTLEGDGEPMPDFLRLNLGTEFLAALAAIALIGTAVPLVAARERGMLRLLGTTPLPRWLFLASRVPARLLLVLVSAAGIAAIALGRRYMDAAALPRFAVTVACASVMLFGVGALFSARARNAEATQQVMAGLALALVFSAGAVLPPALLPAPAQVAIGVLPGGWVAQAAGADLAGLPPVLPVPAYWGLMLAVGASSAWIAARRFRWDGAPPTTAAPPAAAPTTAPATTSQTREATRT